MGIAERRERQKNALRADILAAARDLFVEQGYESVSMRKIAGRIDHSPTAIYLHFKDKSDLLRSICDETFLKLSDSLEALTGARRIRQMRFRRRAQERSPRLCRFRPHASQSLPPDVSCAS